MVNKSKIKISLLRVLIVTGLMLTAIFPGSAQALTQDLSTDAKAATRRGASAGISKVGQFAPLAGNLPTGTIFLPSLLVNTIDTSIWDHPSTDPAGIAYQAATGKLLISDIDVEEAPQTFWEGFNVFQSTLTGTISSNCTTFTSSPLNLSSYNNFSDEPTGITINNINNHIFFSDDNANRIFEVAPGLDGAYCTSDDAVTYVPIGVSPFNITDLEDLAYGQNKLYITSGGDGSATIYEYNLGINGVLGGGDDSSGTLPNFSTSALGFGDVEGIAYNSTAGTLYILSTQGTDTYLGETTTGGTLLRAYDLSYLGSVRRSGLTVAPASGDPFTDSIYIVSRGQDNGSTSNFNDGKIWEIDVTDPVMPDLIFKDGFESNNFSAWTLATTNNGNLNVNASAALFGNYGMRAQINSTTSMDVMDDKPTLETRYRARFYFDPNSIVMASGDTHTIFQGYKYPPYTGAGSPTGVFRVDFRYFDGSYQIRGVILNDSAVITNGFFFPITDGANFIEVDWSAASLSGNNGYLTLWINGVQVQNLPGIDNDAYHVDRVRLGPVSNLDPGTTGTYYFDAFESRRQSYIGPIVATPGAIVDVNIAGNTVGDDIEIPLDSGDRYGFAGVDDGPAAVVSTNGVDIITALRVIWQEPAAGRTSYSEMMGLPVEQLSSEYWFPWYNNVDTTVMSQGFRIANVDSTQTTIKVMLGATELDSFTLQASESVRVNYAVNDGPIQIYSEGGEDILAALRVIWTAPVHGRYSYSEMMGLPAEQLSSEYWFPWYNNLDTTSMTQGFRIASVNGSGDNTVEVYVGGALQESFTLAAGASVRVNYPVNDGPVRVVCTTCSGAEKIITSLRVIWQEPGFRATYSEMMGLPLEQLSTEYWLPWYNNVDTTAMNQGLRIASVNGTGDNTVQVWVGNSMQDSLTLAAGASVRVNYAVNAGPIRIVCTTCSGDEKIISSLRVIWQETIVGRTSYSEMMALPDHALSTTYWFPWYNNAATNSMNQGFRISVP